MLDQERRMQLAGQVRQFVQEGVAAEKGLTSEPLPSEPAWKSLKELGSELWLDTGSIAEIRPLWASQFAAVTTNNTLLNKEVQSGQYDALISQAGRMLDGWGLDERERRLEMAFILNARHGLRLVGEFDANVSVEEHTDLADDIELAVEYGIRYYELCPRRFIIKIPMTPAGIIATRRLSDMGIPVNHTLGFSARQNYVVGMLARPRYVNVFLGRLNAFVSDNGLGDGLNVGERATVASQQAVWRVRQFHNIQCRQIAASFRGGQQVHDLAGVDVLTIPPKVAKEFLSAGYTDIRDRTGCEYRPTLNAGVDERSVRLETLWEIDDRLMKIADELRHEPIGKYSPRQLMEAFADRGCDDLLVSWTGPQIRTSMAEGKNPRLENWKELLASKRIGLDSLMNLAGLCAFRADQQAMDERVTRVLAVQMQQA